MTIFGKIVLGGLLLVVAGGVYYGVNSYVSQDVAVTPTEIKTTIQEVSVASTTLASSTVPEKSQGKKIAFVEFMKKGGSYKCTVIQTVANMTSSGTVYIHNDFLKGSFSTSVQGQTIDSNMIVRDGYTYSWTNLLAGKGFKSKTVDASSDTEAKSSSGYSWNGKQIGEYDCKEWIADDSMFELPKSVTFTFAQ